ncbi:MULTISPECIES: DUF2089 domain-containing protein [unclassified Fusibacter]|uniref:DUF2089 domain-containing protein n=1 Tax=unclassified Fusibacter TaxID=2624464 RepID=UPI001012275D|nr:MULTISPECIES: DUF2089 domain-containing protein [unclassified Fusibacter]MCK8061393.1 DUF2089 domain-containing protein [Fusibacter sp. A2]NPE23564.1 DUF2089 domain-containing protein [Fusibacter sp. A1]RXV58974.1 DUF2089 domain-containing protein [Fusibacter sp. A1]
MKKEVIGKCPVCDDHLKVSVLSCKSCGTSIHGEFELCSFCKLSEDHKMFAMVFIKNRGNIKEIEKELGISYPTVRGKLDDVITALGFSVEKKVQIDKQEVLKRLSSGEITKEEALKQLSE